MPVGKRMLLTLGGVLAGLGLLVAVLAAGCSGAGTAVNEDVLRQLQGGGGGGGGVTDQVNVVLDAGGPGLAGLGADQVEIRVLEAGGQPDQAGDAAVPGGEHLATLTCPPVTNATELFRTRVPLSGVGNIPLTYTSSGAGSTIIYDYSFYDGDRYLGGFRQEVPGGLPPGTVITATAVPRAGTNMVLSYSGIDSANFFITDTQGIPAPLIAAGQGFAEYGLTPGQYCVSWDVPGTGGVVFFFSTDGLKTEPVDRFDLTPGLREPITVVEPFRTSDTLLTTTVAVTSPVPLPLVTTTVENPSMEASFVQITNADPGHSTMPSGVTSIPSGGLLTLTLDRVASFPNITMPQVFTDTIWVRGAAGTQYENFIQPVAVTYTVLP